VFDKIFFSTPINFKDIYKKPRDEVPSLGFE